MSSIRAARPPQPEQEPRPAATTTESSSVTLGPHDRLVGQLYIEGDLRVNGSVEGQVEASGDVDVAEAATVKASLAGREVNISGQVTGSVTASRKLVVSRSGSLVGDVRVPRLVIQDGATFSGNVSMTGAAPAQAKALPVEANPAATEPAPAPPAPQNGPSGEKPRPKRR